MRTKGSKGSALVLVMVSAIVLSILVAALYTLFQMNVRSQAWAKERIQARATAEAGLNLAVHMIMGGADVPQGWEPLQFLPSAGDWHFFDDEMGWVQVWVDPHDNNPDVSSANAYEVRCLSKVVSEDQEHTYGIASMVLPRNFAIYAAFLNSAGAGWFGDGYRFDGPFHCNSVVKLYSATPGRDNDVWFYSFSTTADYYLYGTGVGVKAYEPQIGDLWIEPYERMVKGEPWFNLGAEEIPFGSDQVNWQGAYNAAQSGGLFLSGLQVPDGTRLLLMRDTLLVKTGEFAPVDTFNLSALDNPVVWINNDPGHSVYLKTRGGYLNTYGLPMGLTIGVNGNLVVAGPILYSNIDLLDENNECMLGLVVRNGDFTIAADPDNPNCPLVDWSGMENEMWQIQTGDGSGDYPEGIQVHAIVMALDGYFQLEYPQNWRWNWWPRQATDFEIVGGYIIHEEYVTTWYLGPDDYSGYITFVTYDPRLMTMHPPFFPQTGKWDVAYWEERPDMTVDDISDNRI